MSGAIMDIALEKKVYRIFENQVAEIPDKIAIVGCGMDTSTHRNHVFSTDWIHLSYKELAKRIDRLAIILKQNHIKPGTLVAVKLERSIEMVIAVLAILKIGCAYLPIDPNYPEERIQLLLKDSGAGFVVSDKKELWIGTETSESLTIENSSSDSVLYVLYTSGSTGTPKGVLVEQGSVVNLLESLSKRYPLGHDDAYILKTSFFFDVSVTELFGWFVEGGRLIILEKGGEKDPLTILKTIARQKVTHVNFAPAMFNAFVNRLDVDEAQKLKSVKYIFLAGEALLPELVNRFYSLKMPIALENLYGPTEGTVYVTGFSLSQWNGKGSIPIGKALSNLFILIVDQKGNCVPNGENGELCIAGKGVTRGYLNNPELTAEKFVRISTFGGLHELEVETSEAYTHSYAVENSIVYKTGDLARRLSDGNIEFLGRIDNQVKVRGIRIELGEIESILLEFNGIEEAVVVARESKDGDKFLCAYIVLSIANNSRLLVTQLKRFLSEKIPDYMIPSHFVFLDRLPLTRTGKVDRKVLPEPEIKRRVPYIPPRNEIEKKLVVIWAKALGITLADIGINDQFIDLGGHSLRGALITFDIHKTFNVIITLAELLEIGTIAMLGKYINNASLDKYIPLEKGINKEFYQLSSAQIRMYILHHQNPQGTVYNVPSYYHLKGKIEIAKFRTVIEELIERHESLRTAFFIRQGQPVQHICDHVPFNLEYSEDQLFANTSELQSFIRPFNLSTAPLFRVKMAKTGQEEFYLMIDFHHIIVDGISLHIFMDDLFKMYRSEALDSLRFQYRDYSQWQNRRKKEGELNHQEGYWLGEYNEEIPAVVIPYDFPRPPEQSFIGTEFVVQLEKEVGIELENFASSEKVTLFMLLISVYFVLLAKLSGQEDIIVGTPMNGRKHRELQNIIGMFVNTVAIRNNSSGEKTFTELLNEIKIKILDAYENQEYPFEELVDAVVKEKDPGRNPLFDFVFAFEAKSDFNDQTNSFSINNIRHNSCIAKFDLTLTVEQCDSECFIVAEYCTKLFKEKTVQRFINYYKKILSEILKNPDQLIAQIEILSKEEKKILLYEINTSSINGDFKGYKQNKGLHELFQKQVEKTPDSIALSGIHLGHVESNDLFTKPKKSEMSFISYRDLDNKSNYLASVLNQKGLQPDTIIGLMIERSIEMIAGILGILKTGAAYLPVNPLNPIDRTVFMLLDSNVSILVMGDQDLKMHHGITERMVDHSLSIVYCQWKILRDQPVSVPDNSDWCNPFTIKNSSDLAYIIYTSGTTGKPKGVPICHTNISTLMNWGATTYQLKSFDRVIQNLSYYFDWSVWEIFITLISGSSLYVTSRDILLDPAQCIGFIKRNDISVLHITPSQFQALVNYISDFGEKLDTLRFLFIGAEKLTSNLVDKSFNSTTETCRIFNMYGPTEVTIISSVLEIERTDYETHNNLPSIPIGFASANNILLILDKYFFLSPVGVTGELYISGDGLARGYLNKPELSAEKFISFNTVSQSIRKQIPYSSIYRTGDLVQRLQDGNIVFLGRIDHQVKIRGFRIELPEIENQFLNHPAVKEVIVIAIDSQDGNKDLIAYIVAKNVSSDFTTVEADIKVYLSDRLPDYMVPVYFVFLEKFPLTPNGKIDHKSLPRPKITIGELYKAPTNKMEVKLVELYSELLGTDEAKTGIETHFFKAGGHSLKATQLITLIQKHFGVEVSLNTIFKYPTIRELSRFIMGSEEKKYESINAIEEREYYSLSSAQKRIFILNRMEPQSINYNIPLIFRLEKHPDVNRLNHAMQQLIRRHDSLRTSFHLVNEEPVQRIHEEVKFEIALHDVNADGEVTSHGSFIQPFDLTQAPLIRMVVILNGESGHTLMVDMHHIISDGVSVEIFKQELEALYNEKHLQPLYIQYKDFTRWQYQTVVKETVKIQEKYWLRTFFGELPVLELPLDYSRPAVQSVSGDTLVTHFGEELTKRMRQFSTESDTTLFMSLLACFYLMLMKISGQSDIIAGTPAAGRRHDQLEGIIGMFVNTLALRSVLLEDVPFHEYIKELKSNTLEAFENQEYQFEELVNCLVPQRDVSRNPIFDVIFSFHNLETVNTLPNKLIGHMSEIQTGTAKFDFSLIIWESRDDLELTWEYCSDLFTEETIRRFNNYFQRIVYSIIEKPGIKLNEVVILSDEEKEQILRDFNNTAAVFPEDSTIHDLFRKQVNKTPDSIALSGRLLQQVDLEKEINKETLLNWSFITYKELDEKTNDLAQFIIKKGIGTDSIIGIMLERSIEMVIGVLGILKAGGVYLPIDFDYPEERKRLMLSDSGIQVIISDKKTVCPQLDLGSSLEIIPSVFPSIHNRHPIKNVGKNFKNPLAYIIYTSGSTGKPKGVMVTHQNVLRLVCNSNYVEFNPDDRLLQTGALEFDASTFEIWGTLLNGLKLHLEFKDQILNPVILKKILLQHGITLMWMTAAWFNRVVQEEDDMFRKLRCLMVGGDIVSPIHINKVIRCHPNLKIINGYGPTENTTFSTTFVIEDEYTENIPIGKPITNSTAFIVNSNFILQPVGVPGELLVGGKGISRGYMNNPELTDQKFIYPRINADYHGFFQSICLPTQPLNHSTVYRTGDLASWLQDGNIQFLGRKDQQVKIRGYRIELGEIESRLIEHEGIKEAIVIQKEDNSGDKYLCAYILAEVKDEREHSVVPQDNELREFLLKSLPDYMIPAYFIEIHQIPLTSNGKLDRKALPHPGMSKENATYVPPENMIQVKLLEIWSSVLGIDTAKIGIDDNFFQMGGHSLKGTVVTAKIHCQFNVRLSLSEIFQYPTIRRLSHRLNETVADRFDSIASVETKEYYQLSSAQKRLFVLNQVETNSIQYNIPEIFFLDEKPEIKQLDHTFQQLIQRHESFRTSFHIINDEPMQRIQRDVEFQIFHDRLSTESTDSNTSLKTDLTAMVQQLVQPFDLTQAPLLRVSLISTDGGMFILLADMHHIISDGISIEIFKNEMQTLYSGNHLPALEIQYKEYAQWQMHETNKEKIKMQESYWLNVFEGEIPVLDLPLDFNRPAIQRFDGNTFSVELGKSETTALKILAEEQKSTLFMVLFASFTIFLMRLSSQEDIIVGTPAAGRRHVQLEGIIGMFVNTLALRSKPGRNKIFNDYLREIKSTILDTFENQEYQFEELVSLLLPDRDVSRNPIFDVMFSFQNMGNENPYHEKLKLTPYEYQNVTSKFDLTLTIKEDNGDLNLNWEYCTAIFKEKTIRRFNSYFKQVIQSILNNPGIMINEVSLLTEEEKEHVLTFFNETTYNFQTNKTMHQLLLEQSKKTPDQIALLGGCHPENAFNEINNPSHLICASAAVTYNELRIQSNNVAQELIHNGVQTNTIIAIMMDRSIEMVIGIFGILMSGGAYLPINIDNPKERIHYMLTDSKAKLLISDTKLITKEESPIPVFNFSNSTKKQKVNRNTGLAVAENGATPMDAIAYIIYTSGTTGKPKGVIIEHQSAANLLFSLFKKYPFTSQDTYLFKTSFSFDVSVSEIFGWYIGGGRLSILKQGDEKDPQAIIEAVNKHSVTHINFVPSMFSAFVEHLDINNMKGINSLKYIFLAGEALAPGTVMRFRRFKHSIQLENLYGPTEATVYASWYNVSKWKETANMSNIPIGNPLFNVRLVIVDVLGNPVAIGEPGELCIGGAGLARGYLNNPELTEEKFVWLPKCASKNRILSSSRASNSTISQSRFYRSGDLARWLEDGNILFLGRIDQQIKIRGYRVELGEIENLLLKFEKIREVVVTVNQDSSGDKFLCAYYTAKEKSEENNQKESISGKVLREYLSLTLPDYMIPSYFIELKQIPITSNGKLDRKQLPKPKLEGNQNLYVAAENETQEKLLNIWSSVLAIDKETIGIDHNFFQLGGHSLKGTIIAAKIHQQFNCTISLIEIFKNPTIRRMSYLLEKAVGDRYISIQAVERKEYYPLSSNQKQLYIINRVEPDTVQYNMPEVYFLRKEPDLKQIEYVVKQLIKRHESFRTSFHMVENEPVQRVHSTVEFQLWEDNSTPEWRKNNKETPSNSVNQVEYLTNQFIQPFDLSQTPLLRVGVARIGEGNYILMIDRHHIISDGVSLELFKKELHELYHDQSLPGLYIQYKDYAQWQQTEENKQKITRQEAYWTKEFSGELPVLNLPLDFFRSGNHHSEGRSIVFTLEKKVLLGLNEIAVKLNSTLFMILLASFNIMLMKLCGQDEIIIGTPAAGRRHVQLESIIGMFVNTLALRNFPCDYKSFSEFLIELKANTIDSFENQEYPFEELVNLLAPERDMRRNPLFDVMFSVRNKETRQNSQDNILSKPYEYETVTAKFDLSLLVEEGNDELTCHWEFRSDLFKDSMIKRFNDYYLQVMLAISEEPSIKIEDITIIPEAQRKLIIQDFNRTSREFPANKTIHELFKETAETETDRIAIVGRKHKEQENTNGVFTSLAGKHSLSYGYLYKQVSQLAMILMQKGIGPDAIVGIQLMRSIDMVIGILGILTAGAAYLPIEPNFPEERIRYILSDSGASSVIKDETFFSFPFENESTNNQISNLVFNTNSINLAYIIYTSGSTGRPKGVLVEHTSIVNTLWALKEMYPMGKEDIFLLKTSFLFDVSLTELFGWFIGSNGSKLEILNPGDEKDPRQIRDTIEKVHITSINFVPSMFAVFLDGLNNENIHKLSTLRYMFLAGEALPPDLVHRFNRLNCFIRLENLYGPTEASIYASRYSLSAWNGSGDIPIGHPFTNINLFIFDLYGGLQPIGVPGELVISGIGLARGYLNRPELTADMFQWALPMETADTYRYGTHYIKPSANRANLRKYYKTGDLASWQPDGNIRFLGRLDHQVKIRGFRIETGEIENHLLTHTSVKHALVMAIEKNVSQDTYLCAYFVADRTLSQVQLREFLGKNIPEYMIPDIFLQINEIPLNSNGKIDRKRLPDPDLHRKRQSQNYVAPETKLETLIGQIWSEILHVEKPGIYDKFFDLGGNSMKYIQVNHRLQKILNKEIPMVMLYRYPTINSLANYLQGKSETEQILSTRTIKKDQSGSIDIAVIGMAGRFPGAKNIDEFWENLKHGIESITFFTENELREAGVSQTQLDDSNYVRARGVLDDISFFDAAFFNYTPREADILDPQLRVYHECCWSALEDASYNPDSYPGSIGVYSGAGSDVMWLAGVLSESGSLSGHYDAAMLNINSSFGTRISYQFNLKGPSFSVQTACSTSLVSIHLACRALNNNECDMALAGGVSLSNSINTGYLYQEGMILSPDGHNRTFDNKARGTVPGEGVGVVVLKRLQEAINDRDHIYALVKGSAVNNDGTRKVGYTAPSVEGQAEVIKEAIKIAGIEPGTISYIESHGTATTMGDPIEIQGLKLAFESSSTGSSEIEKTRCFVGSVKSNIGHLDMAAGAAGFIKVALALHHNAIPPSLHFQNSNPAIGIENSPFVVNHELIKWQSGNNPLRAGVSSFGIGGTNAHVVLEEWKPQNTNTVESKRSGQSNAPGNEQSESSLVSHSPRLLVLSARTQSSLKSVFQNLTNYFKKNPTVNLADAAYTLQMGRKSFKQRSIAICSTVDEAIELFSSSDNGKIQSGTVAHENPSVVFMFPGQGSQYVNMGIDLYHSNSYFKQEMDHGFELLTPLLGYNIKQVLYPSLYITESGMPAPSTNRNIDINQTEVAQPLIFLFEYSLARLLIQWGLKPSAMIGHSIGEYTAACLSGVLTLEDALAVVVSRGRLMQSLPSGKMLSVPISEAELRPLLDTHELSLAAINSPSGCVVSGTHNAILEFAKQLKEKGIESRELHTSHAFHSPMMDPILNQFTEKVKLVSLNEPGTPYLSNVTGQWITTEDVTNPTYWAIHLRKTVNFYPGVTELLKRESKTIFLEVGPGRVLSTFVRQHPDKTQSQFILNLVRHPNEHESDYRFLLNKIGNLWLHGKAIDWKAFYGEESPGRISLPTYPFEKRAYRTQTNIQPITINGESVSGMQLTKKGKIDDWLYSPIWKRVSRPSTSESILTEKQRWLVFVPMEKHSPMLSQLIEKIRQLGHSMIMVYPGEEYTEKENGVFVLRPGNQDDYHRMFIRLNDKKRLPQHILHLWGCSTEEPTTSIEESQRILDLTFYPLLGIARSIGQLNIKTDVQLDVISVNMQEVTGEEQICPVKSTLLGPVKTIPLEYPNVLCRSIDLSGSGKTILTNLLAELSREITKTSIIALRGTHYWKQDFESVSMEKSSQSLSRLKEKGVYLITGGLGGMGLELAGYLARSVKARLALIDFFDFPLPSEWNQWLATHTEDDFIAKKIRQLHHLEQIGAEVLVLKADVSDYEQMKQVFETLEDKWGMVNGVIHTAGRPGGRLIQLGTREFSEKVMAPKLDGTLVLNSLVKPGQTDFLVVCSSINSFIGEVGQAEYTAANAFLDAFAAYKNQTDGVQVISINWDTWQKVGMATGEDKREIYSIKLNPKTHWELGEHLINGVPTLVGTAYIKLLSEAFNHHAGEEEIEISNLHYLSPLRADSNEDKEVRIFFEKDENIWKFSLCTVSNSAQLHDSSDLHEHARGEITQAPSTGIQINNLAEIKSKCRVLSKDSGNPSVNLQSKVVEVGERWNNLQETWLGVNEGLALIELPSIFNDDMKKMHLHPALLDIATSFMLPYISQGNAYLPFSLRQVRIKKPLPPKIYSYARLAGDRKGQQQTVELEITIMDETGEIVLEIENFLFMAVSQGERGKQSIQELTPGSSKSTILIDNISEGILPNEGVEVFSKVLANNFNHLLISTVDLHRRLEREKVRKNEIQSEPEQEQPSSVSLHPRPELSTPYSPPQTTTQKALAKVWQDYLGIDEIGINDDFFELGADSLKALTVIAKLHKELHVEISITDMFTYPTIEQLSQYIEGVQESIYSSIILQEEKEYYPLSSAQKRLYYLQQMHEESVFYNLLFPFVVEGNLDIKQLKQAFQVLINRHDSLRTSFIMVNEEPVQRIHSEVKFEIVQQDLIINGPVDSNKNEKITEIIKQFIRPFDLSEPPLLRMGTWKLKDEMYLWVLEIHHIITDATGYAVIQTELEKLYNKESLAPLKVRYTDFSCWQNDLIDSGEINLQLNYWLNVFSGGVPALNFPTDYPRPEIMTYKGDWHHFQLPANETSAFLKLASSQGATLFVALIAILNVLAFKYTGQEDIVIGSSTAGRPHSDIQGIVGMFVNMLPIRNYPQKDFTFVQLLSQVKTTALSALENQDIQFEMLVEQLGIEAGTSGNSLFNICLNVENYEQPVFNFNDLVFLTYPYDSNTAKFDLLLWANRVEEEIYFMLEYSTELFKPSTAEDFSKHLIEVIKQVLENKDVCLQDITISNQILIPESESPEIDFDF